MAEFSVFNGAKIVIIVECKRYNRPVEREVILALNSKLHDVGAHKALIFSTSGFQKGAIEYASTQGIATISFIDGKSNYHSRSYGIQEVIDPPPWMLFPKYAGHFLSFSKGIMRSSLIDDNRLDSIKDWIENMIIL